MKSVVVTGNKKTRELRIEGIYTDKSRAKRHKFFLQANGKDSSTQDYIDILEYSANTDYLVVVHTERTGETTIKESCSSKENAESVKQDLNTRDDEVAVIRELSVDQSLPDITVEYRLFIRTSALGFTLDDDMSNPSDWMTDFDLLMDAISELQDLADWVGSDAFIVHARATKRSGPEIEAKVSHSTVSNPIELDWNTPRNLP